MKTNRINKKGALALSQIFILLVSIVAVSWALGSQIGVVSGEEIQEGTIFPIANTFYTFTEGQWFYEDTDVPVPSFNQQQITDAYLAQQGTQPTPITQEIPPIGAYFTSEGGYYYEYMDGKDGIGWYMKLLPTLRKDFYKVKETTETQQWINSGRNVRAAEPEEPAPSTLPDLTPLLGKAPTGDGIVTLYDDDKQYKIINGKWWEVDEQGNKLFETEVTDSAITMDLDRRYGAPTTTTPTTTLPDDASPEEGDGAWWTVPGAATLSTLWKRAKWTGWQIGQAWFYSKGLHWAAKYLPEISGITPEEAEAIGQSLKWGWLAGHGTYSLFAEKGVLAGFGPAWLANPFVAIGIGAIVAASWYLWGYKEKTAETIMFTCYAWDAQTGGSDCEKCNQQGEIPCTEYQCRSLGQACELVNKGTEEQKCVWNKGDGKSPVIETRDESLLNLVDYTYVPDTALSPPLKGVKVKYKQSDDGCIPAFTPFTFGIKLRDSEGEPKLGKCKIDRERKDSFEDMNLPFGMSSLFRYNHTHAMLFPGTTAFEQEGTEIGNDGEYEFYVRCMDTNGHYNLAEFVFKFCMDKGPDETQPNILGTNWLNDAPVASGITSIEDFEVYVNEPAECKWSHNDKSYDNMENEMDCSGGDQVAEINAQFVYVCETELTGIVYGENNFYFRCKDQPSATEGRNVNIESYEFSLRGTHPLVITSAEPNETTIRGATDSIKVTLEAQTSAGSDQGEATCYYSTIDYYDDYTIFDNTLSYMHTGGLWLGAGEKEYYIRCFDLAGNFDTTTITFTVEKDVWAPMVVRAYHEENYLTIITDEEASCVYDTVDCNYVFEDGNSMISISDTDHFTTWDKDKTFYIKCKDEYANQPDPAQCSIIARPFEI